MSTSMLYIFKYAVSLQVTTKKRPHLRLSLREFKKTPHFSTFIYEPI